MRGPLVLIAVVLLAGGGYLLARDDGSADPAPAPPATATPAPGAASPRPVRTASGDLPTVKIFKSPTCGCCTEWAKHLEEYGFPVELVDTNDLVTVKAALGVPADMGSCHTAQIGDYVVEGHVPAGDIERLLGEAPPGTVGLAVPGMPVGSPGMEMPGQPADRYDVVAFDEDGSRRVYSSY